MVQADLKNVVERRKLCYQGGGSDKVYIIFIVHDEYFGGYKVTVQYGRRGSSLNTGTKQRSMKLEDAQILFGKLITAKLKKGYYEV
jgi:predicted DNA-binding WGR domain protein